VLSQNLHRRNLNESQRAMIATKIANMRHGGDRRSDQAVNLPLENDRITNEDAATKLNVSKMSVKIAKKVDRDCVDELSDAVSSGTVKVSDAVKATDLPKAEQKRAVEMVKKVSWQA